MLYLLEMKNLSFFYFSGTGNTKLLIDEFTKYFEKKNYNVFVKAIENYDILKHKLKDDEVIALFFPVAVFLTYPFVIDFIKKLPIANNNYCFCIPTMGGFSLGLKSHIKYLISKKKYIPIYYSEVIMPDNYFLSKTSKINEIIKNGLSLAGIKAAHIERIIENPALVQPSIKWKTFPFFHHLINVFSYLGFKSMSLDKNYLNLDTSLCIMCGLCKTICPVKNIELNPYPSLKRLCQRCARCYNYCPTKALYRKKGELQYKAIDINNLIK